MKYRCYSPPCSDPINIVQARLQCRLLDSDNDADVSSRIPVAVGYVEGLSGRQLVAATYDLLLDSFPVAGIELPHRPIISVSSISYVDTAGATQTLATTAYQLDADSIPPKIVLRYGQSWPATYSQASAVTVRYICGHATPFTAAASTDVLTSRGRNLADGDVVRLINAGGALPGGLSENTDYYVVSASGATFKLSASLAGVAIDITGPGSGTHFIVTETLDFQTACAAILLMIEDLFYHRADNQGLITSLINSLRTTWI